MGVSWWKLKADIINIEIAIQFNNGGAEVNIIADIIIEKTGHDKQHGTNNKAAGRLVQ